MTSVGPAAPGIGMTALVVVEDVWLQPGIHVPAACSDWSCASQTQRCAAVIPTAPLKVIVTEVQGPAARVMEPPVASPEATEGVQPVPAMVKVVPPLLDHMVPLQKVKAGVPSVV